MSCRLAALLLLALVAAVATAADPWPAFRGPTGDGHAPGTPPLTWAEGKNVRWKTPIPEKGWSSPVVDAAGRVWLTNATPEGKVLSVVAVDLESGKVVRERTVFTVESPPDVRKFNSYASPTPCLDGGRLFAHFGSPGTACLDCATGETVWERRDLPCDHFRGAGSSPVIYKGKLIVAYDGFDHQYVVALDAATGKTLWKTPRTSDTMPDNGDYRKAFATAAVVEAGGRAVAVVPGADVTLGLDPDTGAEVWRVVHGGMNGAARPVFGNGLLFLTSGHNMRLLAVRPTGTGDLTKSNVAWQTVKGIPTKPSLALAGDLLMMVSDNGIASCFDAATGTRVWQERIGGSFAASPVVAAGRLYACDDAGKTHVLAVGRAFKSLAVNTLDSGCMASPAVVGDRLILRTKTHLVCMEAGK